VLIPLLESAKGVLNAREIAAASRWIIALTFGVVNFTRDMGSSLSADGTELLCAQSRIALVARACGVLAVDYPCIDIGDREELVRQAKGSRSLGFGRSC